MTQLEILKLALAEQSRKEAEASKKMFAKLTEETKKNYITEQNKVYYLKALIKNELERTETADKQIKQAQTNNETRKHYGLLITKEKLNGDTIAIYNPIYSDDLKVLCLKRYQMQTSADFAGENIRFIFQIYNYEKMCYIKETTYYDILLNKKTKQPTKYYLQLEALKSNWDESTFTNCDFVLMYGYRETKQSLFFYSDDSKKGQKCTNTLERELQTNGRTLGKAIFKVSKADFDEAMSILNEDIKQIDKSKKIFAFYSRIKNNYNNIIGEF